MRRIDPKYQFRFTHRQIRSSYATMEDAFAAGDFNLVAAEADEPQLKGAARVLMGLPNEGLALLEAQADLGPRGRVVKAFAHWILDAPAEALALLATIPADDPHAAIAADLAAAVATPRLEVLITSQMAGGCAQGDEASSAKSGGTVELSQNMPTGLVASVSLRKSTPGK